jgi:hydrogenase/urease accessory protein HupE
LVLAVDRGVKPSTVAELAGFGLLVAGSAQISPILGLFVAGFVFLFIGYALDDGTAIASLRRMARPLARLRFPRVRRARRKAV